MTEIKSAKINWRELIPEDHYVKIITNREHHIHMKLEGDNVAGSIKIKSALSMIQDLEQQNKINSKTHLIESSSGNLGIALATICANKGYKFTCVVDLNTPEITRKGFAY